MLMQNVVNMTDRFLDRHNPESIDRQERLFSCIALVSIFYVMFSIAFMKLGELEKHHHVFHPELVSFELLIAPPEPKPAPLLPPPTSLDKGSINTGGAHSATPNDDQLNIPTTNVQDAPKSRPQINAHHITNPEEQAPIAAASTNNIIHNLPPLQPAPSTVTPVEAGSSGTTTQGSVQTNGTGTDTDGKGQSGEGKGKGTAYGDGEDPDNAGGAILPPVSLAVSDKRPMGNISPYRARLLKRLAHVWRPKKDESLILNLVIDRSGALIEASVMAASSNKAAKAVMKALQDVDFEEHPDWYKGQELSFKIQLDAAQFAE